MTVVFQTKFFACLGLMLASPWLIRGARRNPVAIAAPAPSSKGLWLTAVVVTLASAIANAPRLHHSFWFDEECTARRFVVGELTKDGTFARVDCRLWVGCPSWRGSPERG